MHSPTGILAIETSNPSAGGSEGSGAGVCLGRLSCEGGVVTLLGMEAIRSEARHDDALMPSIASLMERCGMSPADLALVAVSIGPGGYTSVRIGVTVAKVICEATRAWCVGVPTAEAVYAGVDERVRASERVTVCLAWKRESVWCARAEAGGRLGEGRIVGLDEVVQGGRGECLVAEDRLAEMLRERGLLDGGVRVVRPVFSAVQVMVLGARMGMSGGCVDPAALAPMYPREPEAVTKWRQRPRG